ncbi:unnamed protein product [Acanthoscelides obtectus]|uniref:C2H2-type domain-containing protein n=1 Tax=Acanthoscelides obtectus TaxID=200917 RepID=A0A9P0NYK4_ACAOB|nr:unnamed protein product [Acanthoscelides obtectus]CAK1669679.1 Zinc finger imprinted 3 [Acanthoscelides obtectus]
MLHGQYACDVCTKSYHAYSSFWRHKKHECSRPNSFQCIYCYKSFRQKYDIKKHVRKLHKEKVEEFEEIFKSCDLKIQYKYRIGRFTCPKCGKHYVQKSTLSRHLRYECGKQNQFKCPYCPKTTRQKYDIKLHVSKIHQERRIPECPACKKTYKHKRNLWRHLKYECGVDPQFVCNICSRAFRYKSQLHMHTMTHLKQSSQTY